MPGTISAQSPRLVCHALERDSLKCRGEIKIMNTRCVSIRSRSLVFLTLLALPWGAWAQIITFTYTGTFSSNGIGFVSGQPFSFTLHLHNYAPTTPAGQLSAGSDGAGSASWIDNASGVPQVWTNVTGTGISGQWTPTVTSASQVAMAITAHGPSTNATLTVAAHSGNGALFVNGFTLLDLQISNVFDLLRVTLPNSGNNPVTPPDPTNFFSGYLGTYQRDTGFTPVGRLETGGGLYLFTADTLTIAAVPEPSSYALVFGSSLFLLLLARRLIVRNRTPRS